MRPRLIVDAVLFDMDGTLVDESQSYREAIRLTAEFLLKEPVSQGEIDDIKRRPGFNNDWDATWTLVGRRLHGSVIPASDADRSSQAFRRLTDVFQTYYLGDRLWSEISGREAPFVWDSPLMDRETPLVSIETWDALRPVLLGIATSRPRIEALMALRQHGLDHVFEPEFVVAVEDAPAEKPDPAPLLELIRRLGCERPVYVGDTINDTLAALAAGMPIIAIGTERFDDAVERRVAYRLGGVDEIVAILGPMPTRQRVEGV